MIPFDVFGGSHGDTIRMNTVVRDSESGSEELYPWNDSWGFNPPYDPSYFDDVVLSSAPFSYLAPCSSSALV